MKPLISLLCLATFTVVTSVRAQSGLPPTGGSSTDDAVGSISTIKRPTTKAAPAAAATTGPKKGLEANLSKDEKGKEAASTFAAATPKIYVHFTDDSATKGEKLKAVWIAENVAGVSTKNKKVTEGTEVMPGPGATGAFNMVSAGSGFPVGKYRVELYEGSKLAKSLKFTVTK